MAFEIKKLKPAEVVKAANAANENLLEVTTIDQLAYALEVAKEQRREAEANVHEIENALIKACGAKEEGSTTFKGDTYKVTTIGKLDRKIDTPKVEAVLQIIDPVIASQVFRTKYDLNLAFFRSLEAANKDTYQIISSIITTKPAKTAVTVELLKKEG